MNKSIDQHPPNFRKGETDKEEDPRQRILQAAYRVFVNSGLAGARTREIARLAQVNLAMVHYYFKSKEELYSQVVAPIFVTLFFRLKQAAAASQDPRVRLEAVIGVYFEVLKTHPELPRLLMWDLVTGTGIFKKVFAEQLAGKRDPLLRLLRRIFQEGQTQGFFRPHETDHAIISMVALCVFPFIARELLETINPEFVKRPDFFAERRAHVLDLMLHGLAAHNK